MKLRLFWLLLVPVGICFIAPSKLNGQGYVPPKVAPWDFVRLTPTPHECGNLFLSTYTLLLSTSYDFTNMILDPKGNLLWYYANEDRKIDFTLQPDGHITWYEDGVYYFMDSTFEIVDTLECQEGRRTDSHELHYGANGNYFVLCTRDTAADLSAVQTNFGAWGSSNGLLRVTVIQELDANGNLVKSWDGGPYWSTTDVVQDYFTDLTYMDLMHPNSIDTDTNGQVLLSSRHVSEITCIDWASGAIKWRMGGTQNEFTFANNDPGNNTQHDARFLPGGGISLFDNGTFHVPAQSRAIEYDLDTANRIATPAWSYTHASQISTAMGNYQRLPNGDGLICWGLGNITPYDHVTEVGRDSSFHYKLRIASQYITYRATCHELPFEMNRPVIECNLIAGMVELSVNGTHDHYQWSTGDTSSTIIISDTGSYQVFVPYGMGWAGSEPLRLTFDGAHPCMPTSIEPPLTQKPQSMGLWDLLGRPVAHPVPGRLYIRRFEDGSSQKIMFQP